jgi:hypothetical protein
MRASSPQHRMAKVGTARCEHSMHAGLCVVRGCPHWDGQASPFEEEVLQRQTKAKRPRKLRRSP